MYEETIRLDDGSRLRIGVGMYCSGFYSKPVWTVYVSHCVKRGRCFKMVREFTVGKAVRGKHAEAIKSVLYKAWHEVKPLR